MESFPSSKRQIEKIYHQLARLERQYMHCYIQQWLAERYGQSLEMQASHPVIQTSLALCKMLIEAQTAAKKPLWVEFNNGKCATLAAVLAQTGPLSLSLALIEPDGSFQTKTLSPAPALWAVFEEKEIKIYNRPLDAPFTRICWN